MAKIPMLPSLFARKIYKTGQTRGADDDVIFQNRVGRNSTVLIPYSQFDICKIAPDNKGKFANGFIVLIKPEQFFNNRAFKAEMNGKKLKLGINALLFYETRRQWNEFNPVELKLSPAISRTKPLGGKYVARVPSTTSENDQKILSGFTTSGTKGAGIRVYEYASSKTIELCRYQLEFLLWCCIDANEVLESAGMSRDQIATRKTFITEKAEELELTNLELLKTNRIINENQNTVCPLCLQTLSAKGFSSRLEQSLGRDVPDLTVTQVNLFHIEELRFGHFNHKPYNLGWGHHHCNVVTKDSGIMETLRWMNEIVQINQQRGYHF